MKPRSCLLFLFWLGIQTTNLNAQWVQIGPSDSQILSLAFDGPNLFAGAIGKAYLSTNNGSTWTAISSGLPPYEIFALAIKDAIVIAGTSSYGVYRSTNKGANWFSSGLGRNTVRAFAAVDTNLFAGWVGGGGVSLSTNNGTSWKEMSNGLTNTNVYSLAISGVNLFAGTGDGVFLSSDRGTSWTAANSGMANTHIYTLVASGTNLFAGTDSGKVYCSTNNGTTWTSVRVATHAIYALAVSGKVLFAGSVGIESVYRSTDNGTNWQGIGLTADVRALAVNGTDLYAGTIGGGVARRSLSEITTVKNGLEGAVPTPAALEQNYPNPFNPTTTIRYSLPKSATVSLRIFDALGQEIAALVNERKEAGYYQVIWNATVPSGIYFYRLQARQISGGQAGEFLETKKLIVLR